MKLRAHIMACALVLTAFAAPVSHAGDRRTSAGYHHTVVSHAHASAFAGLGHEGSGLRTNESRTNAFAGLGHEGSGLRTNESRTNAFAGLGHEGSGLS